MLKKQTKNDHRLESNGLAIDNTYNTVASDCFLTPDVRLLIEEQAKQCVCFNGWNID